VKLNHLTIHPDALRLAAVDLARQQADEIKRLRAELAALQEDHNDEPHYSSNQVARIVAEHVAAERERILRRGEEYAANILEGDGDKAPALRGFLLTVACEA